MTKLIVLGTETFDLGLELRDAAALGRGFRRGVQPKQIDGFRRGTDPAALVLGIQQRDEVHHLIAFVVELRVGPESGDTVLGSHRGFGPYRACAQQQAEACQQEMQAIIEAVEQHEKAPRTPLASLLNIGVIGVAPREAELVDSIPPSYFGGNLDNWRAGPGASVFLPVAVPGALPIEGGIPIVADGKIIGAIGVSGAASDQDAQCAMAGVAAAVAPWSGCAEGAGALV